ncbi:MAG: hypothetical protein AMDU4_FER2C00108G0002 [Ferroplasma sp. Type II]|uniref:hypothetical protein n=1 Tax=Ferroplasma sp. Type II TaxID=261388 RepID=UPI0003894A28|nr:hypothetical protein [Ferroplasma sp. Type II]EQB73043.1 MAG: hypothetical protein AMDU4_FER2C00108G0002 [Ferroplasma sp. Type II]
MRIAGFISDQLTENPVKVNYTWYDKSSGIVQWNFENMGSTTRSFILLRGIEENHKVSEIYAFGNAFYPLYYKNFNVDFITKPEALVNVSPKANNAPLAVIENSDSTLLVAFLYTLSGGSRYSVLEGGWKGIEPGGIKIVLAKYAMTDNFSIKYDEKQCTLYNEESKTDYGCPENPFTVRSALMKINNSIKPLFNDRISVINDGKDGQML